MPQTEDPILLETADHILTIRLNRPEKRNTMTRRMAASLIEIFDDADRDDDVRVIVMTGTGDYFCAGADLAAPDGAFKGITQPGETVPRDFGGLLTLRMFRSKKRCSLSRADSLFD